MTTLEAVGFTIITVGIVAVILVAVYYLMKMASLLDEDNAEANQLMDQMIDELHKNDEL